MLPTNKGKSGLTSLFNVVLRRLYEFIGFAENKINEETVKRSTKQFSYTIDPSSTSTILSDLSGWYKITEVTVLGPDYAEIVYSSAGDTIRLDKGVHDVEIYIENVLNIRTRDIPTQVILKGE